MYIYNLPTNFTLAKFSTATYFCVYVWIIELVDVEIPGDNPPNPLCSALRIYMGESCFEYRSLRTALYQMKCCYQKNTNIMLVHDLKTNQKYCENIRYNDL